MKLMRSRWAGHLQFETVRRHWGDDHGQRFQYWLIATLKITFWHRVGTWYLNLIGFSWRTECAGSNCVWILRFLTSRGVSWPLASQRRLWYMKWVYLKRSLLTYRVDERQLIVVWYRAGQLNPYGLDVSDTERDSLIPTGWTFRAKRFSLSHNLQTECGTQPDPC
jgi:hypothetical protein